MNELNLKSRKVKVGQLLKILQLCGMTEKRILLCKKRHVKRLDKEKEFLNVVLKNNVKIKRRWNN